MKKPTYLFHPELKQLGRVRLGNVRVTRPLLALYNAFGAASVSLYAPPRSIQRARYRIDGYQRKIRLTAYTPKLTTSALPCLLYFHGGGFITRDTHHLHHNLCAYAAQLPCQVILVNYRLAPRYPFPAGLQDCYQSLLWVQDNAESLGIDAGRIAIGGDSAGAALATTVALMARDNNRPALRAQLLLYPVIDPALQTQSMRDLEGCPMCNPNLLRQMWAFYLKDGTCGLPQYVSPAAALSLDGLPPAYIETAEFDALKDEGKAYAERLEAAHIPVTLNETKGTFHAYDTAYKSEPARLAITRRLHFLKTYLYPAQ